MIKQLAVSGAVLTAVFVPAVSASATVDPEACQNFARPIIISDEYDPLHLDTDGDGIACEGNPGEPVKTDLYADLRGEGDTNTPAATPSASPSELAHTGAGDMIHRHPVRSIGLGVVLVGAGGALVLVTRRRHSH
jgi:hypothetical protein